MHCGRDSQFPSSATPDSPHLSHIDVGVLPPPLAFVVHLQYVSAGASRAREAGTQRPAERCAGACSTTKFSPSRHHDLDARSLPHARLTHPPLPSRSRKIPRKRRSRFMYRVGSNGITLRHDNAGRDSRITAARASPPTQRLDSAASAAGFASPQPNPSSCVRTAPPLASAQRTDEAGILVICTTRRLKARISRRTSRRTIILGVCLSDVQMVADVAMAVNNAGALPLTNSQIFKASRPEVHSPFRGTHRHTCTSS
ncbi:hypothetical protein L226DRAFT_347944 [Lentinus tigrinus ALCF2SS1-7]|uniref:Uncharacterized protein n=1 Tax=Lentinus tigrinus ALCF2SS1-6 TaxID=1328759 RepID=A0A5C2RP21_9APHY|nr:hypothetical protein L227DRAFT_421567 [Lentinus tigrinus ALCF2SS1-6]RPD68295.1 hypothetical protein L226DRAFT_347944 [Lentinus tigrinus ALCF2SS1-7]